MVHVIILAFCAAITYAPIQIGSSNKDVDVDDIKKMIDKAGWFYKDGNVARSAVEVRRAQRYLEKIIRETHGPLGVKVIKEYDRLSKAHKLLASKGANMRPLKPIPDPAARIALSAIGSNSASSANSTKSEKRGDPFSQNSSAKDRSADPFAQAGSSTNSTSTGSTSNTTGAQSDPFKQGSGSNSQTSNTSNSQGRGDPFAGGGSGSGSSKSGSSGKSAGQRDDPFAGSDGSRSNDSAASTGRKGDPFAGSSGSGSSGSGSSSKTGDRNDPFAGNKSGGNPSTGSGGGISFAKEIAPILVKNCGQCHIKQSRGKFSMASYQSLIDADSVIAPNDPNKSLMIQLIEDGEMPKGGSVSDADKKKLKEWIAQGAKFDGNDASAKIDQ